MDALLRTEAQAFQKQMASQRPQSVDPPGAVIEIENAVRGRTPCRIYLDALPNGKLLGGVEITAIPTEMGDFVQRKLLLGGRALPDKIFFNMHLGPPRPTIDVNVH